MSEDEASSKESGSEDGDERLLNENDIKPSEQEEEEIMAQQGSDIEEETDRTKRSDGDSEEESDNVVDQEESRSSDNVGSEQEDNTDDDDDDKNQSKSADSSRSPEEHTEATSEDDNQESKENDDEGMSYQSSNEDGQQDEQLADLDDDSQSEVEDHGATRMDDEPGSIQQKLVDDSKDKESSWNKKKRTYSQHKGLAPLDLFATEGHYLRYLRWIGRNTYVKKGQNPLRRAYGVPFRKGQDPLKYIADVKGKFKTTIPEEDKAADLSSSEESSEEEFVPAVPIDWSQAEYGGKESLFDHMKASDEEMSSMVGWATFLTTDKCGDSHNPLLGLPNTPLPPEILEYISDQVVMCQSKRQLQHRRLEWTKKTYLARRPDNKRDECDPAMHFLQYERREKDKEFWKYNSDDETYKWIKRNFKSTKLIDITTPDLYTGNKRTKPIPLDISGRVAIGMAIEDMITASLLPFAQRHVEKCREKENLSRKRKLPPGETRDDKFSEWTLPPEEAIITSDGKTSLLSSMPVKGSTPAPVAVLDWCRSRQIDPFFVKENMDVYSKILPCPPKPPPPDVLKTEETQQVIRDLKNILREIPRI